MASGNAAFGVQLVHANAVMLGSKMEMVMEMMVNNNKELDKLLVEMEMEEMVQLQQQLAGRMASCSMVMLQHTQLKKLQMMMHVEDCDENNSLALLQMVGWRLKLYDETMCSRMWMRK